MKNIILLAFLISVTFSLVAQEQRLIINLGDEIRYHNISDIANISFENASTASLLNVHRGNDVSKLPTLSIDSIYFGYNHTSQRILIVKMEDNTVKEYVLNNIDSLTITKEYIINIEMVVVAAGSFYMGDSGEYNGTKDEKPVHHVTLTEPIMMSKYEITQKQYEAVMKENPSYFIGANRPVETVSWLDAIRFCNRLSEIQGLSKAYYIDDEDNVTWDPDARGYRLPTEAEWEYACKAGTSTDFYSGNLTHSGITPLDPNLDKIGWYEGNSDTTTHDVGLKSPNNFGLYDMSGNVWEWCWDRYDIDTYTEASRVDPAGPSTGNMRVLRGGHFYNHSNNCRSSKRWRHSPNFRYYGFGIRIVKPLL